MVQWTPLIVCASAVIVATAIQLSTTQTELLYDTISDNEFSALTSNSSQNLATQTLRTYKDAFCASFVLQNADITCISSLVTLCIMAMHILYPQRLPWLSLTVSSLLIFCVAVLRVARKKRGLSLAKKSDEINEILATRNWTS